VDARATRDATDGPLDTSVPVVVLKMHHGSLGIARTLGRLGIAVYCLTARRGLWAESSRYWRGVYDWDVENAPVSLTLDFLLDLGRRLGSMPLLIAVSDRTALFVAEHADTLASAFRFPRVTYALAESLTSKKNMYFLARRCGIPTADTQFPQSREELIGLIDGTRFPVLLKGIDGVRLQARTGRTMAIVRDAAELLEQYDRLEDPASPNLMLQEYIPGGEDSVWMFNGYFDDESRVLMGMTGQKIRQTPPYTGSTSLGIVRTNAEVAALTSRFMRAIGYRGILDIGFRYDARDGQYKVLDVNPRIGSTFRLFVARNGLDVARVLYRHMTGQSVPAASAIDGRKWIVEDQDLFSCRRYRRDGRLNVVQWIASFKGLREGAWFAWDDLRPFSMMCRMLAGSGGRWIARKVTLPLRRKAIP
jgi:predicted ATP-grasp superfamily ATP-dependent carboligase